MQLLLTYQWEIFIILEVCSLLFLLLFISIRYLFVNVRTSYVFLLLFFILIVLEAVLAFIIYQQTGEFTTFQIVIAIFIIYAATFGISDFKKLDRYVKAKLGEWKGVELLTEKEREIMAYLKDSKVIARKSRYWFYAHTIVFVVAIASFWMYAGNTNYSIFYFVRNLDWLGGDVGEQDRFLVNC